VICPNELTVEQFVGEAPPPQRPMLLGAINCVWLNTLNISARNSRFMVSVRLVSLCSATFQLLTPGPWKKRRLALPCDPMAEVWNAVGSKKRLFGLLALYPRVQDVNVTNQVGCIHGQHDRSSKSRAQQGMVVGFDQCDWKTRREIADPADRPSVR